MRSYDNSDCNDGEYRTLDVDSCSDSLRIMV